MGQKTVYLIRHGIPKTEDQQRRFIGQVDIPLSPEGIAQAERLGMWFKSKRIDEVLSSDLSRAQETGKRISDVIEVPHHSYSQLREIALGKWDGFTFSEIAKLYPDAFKMRGSDIAYFKPPEGESFMELKQRAVKALEDILSRPSERIVVIGHAGLNRMILCHLLGVPVAHLFRIAQDYGCINWLQFKDGACQVKWMNTPI